MPVSPKAAASTSLPESFFRLRPFIGASVRGCLVPYGGTAPNDPGGPFGAGRQSSGTKYGETLIQPLPAAPLRVPLVVLARVYQEST